MAVTMVTILTKKMKIKMLITTMDSTGKDEENNNLRRQWLKTMTIRRF